MMDNLENLAFNERPDYQELLAIAKGMDSNFKQHINALDMLLSAMTEKKESYENIRFFVGFLAGWSDMLIDYLENQEKHG